MSGAKRRTADADVVARRLFLDLGKRVRERVFDWDDIDRRRPVSAILKAAPVVQIGFITCTMEAIARVRSKLGKPAENPDAFVNLRRRKDYPGAAALVMARLLRNPLPASASDVATWLNRTADLDIVPTFPSHYTAKLVAFAERYVKKHAITKPIAHAAERLASAVGCVLEPSEQKLAHRLRNLAGANQQLALEGGEPWADQAARDVERGKKRREAWGNLFGHCLAGRSGSPTPKWLAASGKVQHTIGFPEFQRCVLAWFALVDEPRTQPVAVDWRRSEGAKDYVVESNANVLRGLAWCCALREDERLARGLTTLALSAYRKLPGIGPRLVKVGNACVWALGNMPGIAGLSQLAILKTRVKFGTAQKLIEKALTATAQRLGLPRDEIEEMAVPTYGLEEAGRRRETFGDFTAELVVMSSADTEIRWSTSDGKSLKSAPAVVKKEHAEDVKELTQAAKDVQKMLSAQRERIDTLHLAQKSWPLAVWRERYLDHPLVGVVARRLIWTFRDGERVAEGIYSGGELLDLRGRALKPRDEATVELWHPIGKSVDDIRAWRAFLEERQIQQPFKQAHREIYLLTDAERRTRTYSNRFAAHVLRQHQFNALCAARGWKNKLRLFVDQDFPPATLHLPKWNLRAEFWVEGIGDGVGHDTNETGVFLRVATDQVRFHRPGATESLSHGFGGGYARQAAGPGAGGLSEPVPLEQIPPLVFSEVMRDVDLFVGVASVGNDPTWQDGGPDGRFRQYWGEYAFGELGETAKTRRAVLERLVPWLRIADRCSLADKFLVVRGELRTYKIHLGSGNILMEPNDQYLCIVAGRGGARRDSRTSVGTDGKMYLPFEGDERLSIIVSKALMLAEDTKITDETITRQIRER